MTTIEQSRPTTGEPFARLDLSADDVGRGFGELVLALADILRELLERQAIRRIDAGDLDDAQIERLGISLMHISQQIGELRVALAASSPLPSRRENR
jgi:Gas vesicle protein K